VLRLGGAVTISSTVRRATRAGAAVRRFWLGGFSALLALAILMPAWVQGQVNVLTYHNDVARTGQNLNETILTPSNVNQNSFGSLYTYSVDGWIVGQPLYVQNVAIQNQGSHNVVYVATLHDSVYAFDADTTNGGQPLWQVSFIDPDDGITSVPATDAGCNNVTQFTEQGVIGTPVIDPVAGTLYVVAKTKENGSYFQRLHALDITSGQERIGSPVVISGTFPGTGDGNTVDTFNALEQAQRPALLLNNGTLFVAFAGNGCQLVHNYGWMFAYDPVSLQQLGIFNMTPDANNGGVWQAGSGPAADSEGNIFVETADATFDADTGGPDYGDSVLKFTYGSGGLQLADSFTPFNQDFYGDNDKDLSALGPIVLPDQQGAIPHLLLGGGKDETVYLINRDAMGGYNSVQDQIVQELPPLYTKVRVASPSYWNGFVYFSTVSEPVIAYSLTNGVLSSTPVSQTTTIYTRNNPSSISSNGTQNGILWMLTTATSNPTLRAYDATNLATEFYDSDQAGTRDTLSAVPHFALPTIASGKVYLGTQTQLAVYGLLGVAPTATPSPTSVSFPDQVINTTSASRTVTITNNGAAPLVVNSVTVSGDFAQTNTCTTSIAVGANCTISVTFTPTALGSRTGSLTIADNAANTPQTVPLSGNGISSGAPAVSLSPANLNFPTQILNTASAIQTVTLTNTGTATLTVSSVTISGTNAGDFSQTNTCTSVAPGNNCTISVTFDPTAIGKRMASVSITDNATGSPQSLPLAGIGTSIQLSPAKLTFSTTLLGTSSVAQSSTMTNVGTTKVTINSITMGGNFPGDYSQTNTCGTSLAGGANCTISVTFTPTAIGSRPATVTVTDNGGGTTQKVSLSGTGTEVSLSPPSINFGSQKVGTTSAAQMITLRNVGNAAMTVTGIAISGTNANNFRQTNTCGTSVAAGASCTITVNFRPSATGTRTANVTISDNGGGSPQTVALSGTGI
jgi:Abnormal spindle-like microcephaly-assoc'd, ASPM-SPD-2-Hydin